MGRFQPGQSGNPKGQSRRAVEDAQQSALLAVFDEAAERRAIAAMVESACGGDVAAFKTLMDRKYGKVKDVVEEKAETVVRVEYAE